MRKFTESLNSIKRVPSKTISFYELTPLLDGLEPERPGIKNRILEWMNDTPYDKPIRGKLKLINLFFYGVGDEYETDYLKKYPNELEDSKKRWPKAFEENTSEKELRLDLNLIIHIYQDELGNELDMRVMY